MAKSRGKQLIGKGFVFNTPSKDEKGMKIAIALIKEDNATTGADAQL